MSTHTLKPNLSMSQEKRVKTSNSILESDEQEELSYVVLLKDWEISPTHLKLTDKKLGSGQFGIVKRGLYTPKNSASEIVAVKMLTGAY